MGGGYWYFFMSRSFCAGMLRRFEEGREGMTAVSFYYGSGTRKIQLNGSWFLMIEVKTAWRYGRIEMVLPPHGYKKNGK